jgi:hypothetical protein
MRLLFQKKLPTLRFTSIANGPFAGLSLLAHACRVCYLIYCMVRAAHAQQQQNEVPASAGMTMVLVPAFAGMTMELGGYGFRRNDKDFGSGFRRNDNGFWFRLSPE